MIIDDNTHVMRITGKNSLYLATIRSYVYCFSFDILDSINNILKSYEKERYTIATAALCMPRRQKEYELYQGKELVAVLTVYF